MRSEQVAVPGRSDQGTGAAEIPEPLRSILDLGRWAISGDNTQPWRFEILAEDRVRVHTFDERDTVVYDIDGRPSQIAVGALLETITIAASSLGRKATATLVGGDPHGGPPLYEIVFKASPGLAADPLANFITTRAVYRNAMATSPISPEQRAALAAAVGPNYTVKWFSGWADRRRFAWMLFRSAYIRMVSPEAFEVHRAIIEWGATTSEDRIPEAALGASAPLRAVMKWGMRSWKRVDTMNRFFAGSIWPRIEMDLIPGVFCGAHWALIAARAPSNVEEFCSVGRAIQRFWLVADQLGLRVQPEVTPMVFAWYAARGTAFSRSSAAVLRAKEVRKSLGELVPELDRLVFLGRIGRADRATTRSSRKPLAALILKSPPF